MTGVGLMEASICPAGSESFFVELYSETLPPVTGMPSSAQPSASPVIASTSCHIGSGCSGLPQLRQTEIATGRAPAHAALREDYAGARRAPVCGSGVVVRPWVYAGRCEARATSYAT